MEQQYYREQNFHIGFKTGICRMRQARLGEPQNQMNRDIKIEDNESLQQRFQKQKRGHTKLEFKKISGFSLSKSQRMHEMYTKSLSDFQM